MTDIETLASYNDVIMLNGIGILCNTDVMDESALVCICKDFKKILCSMFLITPSQTKKKASMIEHSFFDKWPTHALAIYIYSQTPCSFCVTVLLPKIRHENNNLV